MMELLAEAINYKDRACINIFRRGGQLHGKLEPCGNGIPKEPEKDFDPELLYADAAERNKRVRCTARGEIRCSL